MVYPVVNTRASMQPLTQRSLVRCALIAAMLGCLVIAGCKHNKNSGSSCDSGSGNITRTLTYTAGANGRIKGDSSQTVKQCASGTAVTATPEAGYVFNKWSDGSSANPRTDHSVTTDISVTARFVAKTHTLTYKADPNGSISGTSPQTVIDGADGSAVTAAPHAGYAFDKWSDGSTAATRTDTNITADLSVTASFALNLAAPTNVSATSGDKLVTVTWGTVPNADGYDLCYSTQTIPDFANCSPGGTLIVNTTSPYGVTGLANGTNYYFRVAATLNGETGQASAEASTTPAPTSIDTATLNDTGIDWCSNYSNLDVDGTAAEKTASCASHETDYPRQDGMIGRDAQAREGGLPKTGSGVAGFDFTKVCNSGQIAGTGACPADPGLGGDANNWGCTRDNVTGLIWEVKTDDGGLRDKDNSYSWRNTNGATNGGDAGTANGGQCPGNVSCDTQSFADAVNVATLCGASDWRLPTIDELISVTDYGLQNPPSIDPTFFLNTNNGLYWATASAFTTFQQNAWTVNFGSGAIQPNSKSDGLYVRLVSDGK